MDLSACVGRVVTLSFSQAYAFANPDGQQWFDGGILQVSGDAGTTWRIPTVGYPGTLKIRKRFYQNGVQFSCAVQSFEVDEQAGFVKKQLTNSRFEVDLPASIVGKTTRIRFAVGFGVAALTEDADTSRAKTDFGWRIDDITFEAK
jgi:hypothetical protein